MSKQLSETERLRKIVESFPQATVTVLGDMVADEFVYGEIARVSREAPVLILKHREREVVPGGGANAVYNLADLGVNVLPVGVVGEDETGKLLLKRFRQKHIPTSALIREKGYATVTKTRILAGMTHSARQQVVRVDREPESEPSQHVVRELILAGKQYAHASDALLVSDYGYGAATPNEPEVEELLRLQIGNDWAKLLSAGEQLMKKMKLQSLVITRGRDGMVVFTRKQKAVDVPIYGSDQVTDVAGAGDTVIATYTAALAAGADPQAAAQLANYAGGIVVMKRGTATVTRQELLDALQHVPPVSRQH